MNINLGSSITRRDGIRRGALIMILISAAAPAMAQPGPAPSLQDRNGLELFNEVEFYIQKKAPSGGKSTPEILEKLKAEQRELAVRYAAELAGRPNLGVRDEYYLGLLYHMAEDAPRALSTMRQFLVRRPDFSDSGKQTARIAVVRNAIKLKQYDEAEQALEEYTRNQPQGAEALYVMEAEIAYALFKAGKYDRVPAHARSAFAAVRQIRTVRGKDVFERDNRLMSLASLMADAYNKLKKKDEALGAIRELRDVALDLPSTNLYRMVRAKLSEMGKWSEANSLVEAEKARYDAPELTVAKWLDEERLALAGLRGSVVIVDFWATWCGPCHRMFPMLTRWHEKYKDKGLVVIGLTEFEGGQNQIRMTREEELRYLEEFRKKNALKYHIGVAGNSVNSFNYGVRGIPTTVLIDRRGMVRFMSVGVSDGELSLLNEMVGKLLKEQEQN